jgi:hypothetical protein
VNCHAGQFTAGFKQTPDAYHGVSARLEELRIQREEFAFSLVSVTDAVYEGTPVVQWQVLDGAGVPYNLNTDISIDGGPRLHIGWGYRDDWTNEGSGEKSSFGQRQNDDNGRPVALNVATTGDNANTVISADGLTAISTFPRLTDAEAGQGRPYADLAAAEEGRRGFVAIHRRVSDNGAIRQITSLVQPIILGSGEVEFAPARRNTVDATFGVESGRRGSGCLDCHGTIDRARRRLHPGWGCPGLYHLPQRRLSREQKRGRPERPRAPFRGLHVPHAPDPLRGSWRDPVSPGCVHAVPCLPRRQFQ